jgi:putative nucleotidyltransferase with HDIG domain
MRVYVVSDSITGLSAVRALLEPHYAVVSELLGQAELQGDDFNAVIVDADLRVVESISALRKISGKLNRIPKRVFLIDQKARLSIAQAYALGATAVLINPVQKSALLAKLADRSPVMAARTDSGSGAQEAAMAGAVCMASLFSAVSNGMAVDVKGTKLAGSRIADSIAEDGLSDWLATVRRHHEGTYQHCLLVTGIAVDFGLSLGVGRTDIERLQSAAMFHDVGKARIPLAILDKPERLDRDERALVETHPAVGYEALKGNPTISQEVLDVVRHHHEALDGSGYPDGLCAGSISDLVRILTISDIFAALIEQRTYKPTMSREQAYEILRGMHGKLEMSLVAAFRDVALSR